MPVAEAMLSHYLAGADCSLSGMFPMQDVPVADAKPEDIQDLLGGALFRALYKWMEETGPVYLLPTGARSSTAASSAALGAQAAARLQGQEPPEQCYSSLEP